MREENRKKKILGSVPIYIILLLWAATTIYPFIWLILNSFKSSREILNSSFNLPQNFSWLNYINAFGKQNILRAYGNSLVISGSTMLIVLLIGSLAAFAMTRYQFKFKKIIYFMIVGSLMFPVFATIIPVFKMIVKWNLVNQSLGVIIPQTATNLAFAVIVLMGFMDSLPYELEEASFLEGASVSRIYTKVIVPLSKPALASVAIFVFLWSYNDLFTQMIVLRRRETFPVCALLNEISSKYGTDFGLMTASVVLVVVPVLVVYILLQKNIVKGLTAGAVKG
ncbi:carbohydrate ABC transporter permease [Anaerocolumna xylanovorans]|uniref:Raffinose/stachyose/melibiose transport system permease protein n=1 Tax=Anaerocolumna xylanovorans DSM 12503 TaxID=1121345 RepID=A0A1M7XY25_9FIRM|nr:carbohydrate ABC transporter permease [Anaerocolumna xylanovorans]SHO43910.1 raffinose/stachyose/melibiose transport system permease protein [Anaerocolumna xylanovorans DSM 12503]